MMASLWSRDHGTIYRPDTKWRRDFGSQNLHELLTPNFIRYAGLTKDLHQ